MARAILLDLDGTVYCGRSVIAGVPAVIARWKESGIRIFFISNSSSRTRKEQAEKLTKLGIACSAGEVYNTAYATAVYIREHYPGKTVYCASEEGLQRELEKAGIRLASADRADIVAAGLDRALTYEKLGNVINALERGAVFIASNADRLFPVENQLMAGAGAMVAYLTYATRKRPILVGKPKPYLVRLLLAEQKLRKEDVILVGDNPETDIAMARRTGIQSVLVLTGLAKNLDIQKLPPCQKPDLVVKNLQELVV